MIAFSRERTGFRLAVDAAGRNRLVVNIIGTVPVGHGVRPVGLTVDLDEGEARELCSYLKAHGFGGYG